MKSKREYYPGETAIYIDHGTLYKVEIEKSNCNIELEMYELKISEVILQNPMHVQRDIGDTFECKKSRRAKNNGGLWHIVDEEFPNI